MVEKKIKDIVAKVLTKLSSVEDKYILKALYIVGPSGSGKSTLKKKLLKDLGLSDLVYNKNADDFLELMAKNKGISLTTESDEEEKLRLKTIKMIKDQSVRNINALRPMVIDIASTAVVLNEGEQLQKYGYDVAVLFIDVTKEQAVDRNNRRKERKIPERVVKLIWNRAYGDKDKIKEKYKDNFRSVDNTISFDKNPDKKSITQFVKDFFTKPILNSEGKKIIKELRDKNKKTLKDIREVKIVS